MEQVHNAAEPVVMCSIFTLRHGYKWWAFRKMGLANSLLSKAKGLQFGKMLGTGNGRGFSLQPDFGRYMLLTSWNSDEAARYFQESASLHKALSQRSREVFTVKLLPVMSKGYWEGENPFESDAKMPEAYNGPVVALTRATIRWRMLPAFWRHVPGVSQATTRAEGLLAQTGMGERPIVQQATFSIWQDERALKSFAYQMGEHQTVIRKTRSQRWYREELFARFIPLETSGHWDGENPLAESLQTVQAVREPLL